MKIPLRFVSFIFNFSLPVIFFSSIRFALHFLESTKERMEHLTATAEEKVWLAAARFLLQVLLVYTRGHRGVLLYNNNIKWHYIPRRIHEVKVSAMRRHKVEIRSTDNSNPNTDNFRLIVVRWTLNSSALELTVPHCVKWFLLPQFTLNLFLLRFPGWLCMWAGVYSKRRVTRRL